MNRIVTAILAVALTATTLVAQEAKQSDPSKKPEPPKVESPLTKDNGPWMVLVKSFQGPQAVEYANKLARELRDEHKIKAYVLPDFIYKRDGNAAVQPVAGTRGHTRSYQSAAVLAGDFKNEKDGKRLRDDKIVTLRPKCITREMVSAYQWAAGPLGTSCVIPNPLAAVPADKVKPDPLLPQMNSGKNNLYGCAGPFTLQIIDFEGGAAFGNDTLSFENRLKENKRSGASSVLEAAGEHAELLTNELRKKGIEAYVFHGRYGSIVCVGSFADENDPQIAQLANQFTNHTIMDPIKRYGRDFWPSVIPVPQKSAGGALASGKRDR